MQYKENLPFGKLSVKYTSLSLLRLWGMVVYNTEKIDKLDARKPRDFSLFNTSHEFLIDHKYFYGPFIDFFTIFYNMLFDSSKTWG